MTDDAFIEATSSTSRPRRCPGTWSVTWSTKTTTSKADSCLPRSIPFPIATRSSWRRASSTARRRNCGVSKRRLDRLSRKSRFRSRSRGARTPPPWRTRPEPKEALKLTIDSVEKGVDEAQAGLAAANADLVFAQEEYTRFSTLYKQDAVPLRRSQEVTRSRDAAEAQCRLAAAKLAKAEAERTQIEVAKRTLEAAEKTAQKAARGSTWPRRATPRSEKWSC